MIHPVTDDAERVQDLLDLLQGRGPRDPRYDGGRKLTRAVGYTRVSSPMQIRDGESMEDQEQRIVEYIRAQGWELKGIIKDPAQSARTGRRPGFQRLIKLVSREMVDVVVTDKIDRISRNLNIFLGFIDLLKKHNVLFISLREGIGFDTPIGKVFMYILGAFAEFYSDNLSGDMKVKKLTNARNGYPSLTYTFGYCSGRCSRCQDPNGKGYCPFYGERDMNRSKVPIPHPIESLAVKEMFRLYATGEYSYKDVAEIINSEVIPLPDGREVHFRTKGRPGVLKDGITYQANDEDRKKIPPVELWKYPPGPFDDDAVRQILRNPLYAGYVPYMGSDQNGKKYRKPRKLFQGKHEPLVDMETFERVQRIREERRRRHPAKGGEPKVYPLSKILVCAHRHRVLRNSSTGPYRYYVDRTCQNRYGERHQPNIPADAMDEKVRKVVREMNIPTPWLERVLAYAFYGDEGTPVSMRRELLVDLETEKNLYRSGVVSAQEFQQRRERLLRKLEALVAGSSPAAREAIDLLKDFPRLLSMMTPREENALYRSIFSSIVVQGKEIVSMEAYDPFLPLHPGFKPVGSHEPILKEEE